MLGWGEPYALVCQLVTSWPQLVTSWPPSKWLVTSYSQHRSGHEDTADMIHLVPTVMLLELDGAENNLLI